MLVPQLYVILKLRGFVSQLEVVTNNVDVIPPFTAFVQDHPRNASHSSLIFEILRLYWVTPSRLLSSAITCFKSRSFFFIVIFLELGLGASAAGLSCEKGSITL